MFSMKIIIYFNIEMLIKIFETSDLIILFCAVEMWYLLLIINPYLAPIAFSASKLTGCLKAGWRDKTTLFGTILKEKSQIFSNDTD